MLIIDLNKCTQIALMRRYLFLSVSLLFLYYESLIEKIIGEENKSTIMPYFSIADYIVSFTYVDKNRECD